MDAADAEELAKLIVRVEEIIAKSKLKPVTQPLPAPPLVEERSAPREHRARHRQSAGRARSRSGSAAAQILISLFRLSGVCLGLCSLVAERSSKWGGGSFAPSDARPPQQSCHRSTLPRLFVCPQQPPTSPAKQDISGVVNDIVDSDTPGVSASPCLSKAEHPTRSEDISGGSPQAAPQQRPISELSQQGSEKQLPRAAKAVRRMTPTASSASLQASGAAARSVNTALKVAPPSARHVGPQCTRRLSVESPRQQFGGRPAPKASVRAEAERTDAISMLQGALEEATKQLHFSQVCRHW